MIPENSTDERMKLMQIREPTPTELTVKSQAPGGYIPLCTTILAIFLSFNADGYIQFE